MLSDVRAAMATGRVMAAIAKVRLPGSDPSRRRRRLTSSAEARGLTPSPAAARGTLQIGVVGRDGASPSAPSGQLSSASDAFLPAARPSDGDF
jgi:hypothetical protein